ncbi:MAG: hypothetical protein NFCOHLIN_02928 [Gammaproteobacteria bacterium]|nr:hypothetical protein [Gammaproteobacteria bacterium]
MEALRHACRGLSATRIIILTTHQPFSNEIQELRRIGSDVRILPFADLLSDEELAECDAAATSHCRGTSSGASRNRYVRRFMAECRRVKNRAVCERILLQYQPRRMFVAEDLGIDSETWIAAGAQSLSCPPLPARSPGFLALFGRAVLQEMNVIPSMSDDTTHRSAVVFGPMHRIAIRENVMVLRKRWLSPNAIRRMAGVGLVSRSVRSMLAGYGANIDFDLCTTVHGYSAAMSELAAQLGQPLRILVDGHHPSNYSISYLDAFDESVFVVANHISAKWFQLHGRAVVPVSWFQASERFESCEIQAIRNVMLVLNHAGDWSALINRSDTDRLTEEFAELAGCHPGLQFIIRMHPSMATPDHEGVRSMQRIRTFVAGVGYENLSVSDRALSEDLARCELYVSEYSQVLIDAWKCGRLGVAFNLTERRSFMDDYRRLGFPHVEGRGELKEWFTTMLSAPTRVCAAQNMAVARFNRDQEKWEQRASGFTRAMRPTRVDCQS